ncbi:hypothetical protein VSS74_22415 [Conexibacter stalactiti]|uniref:Uncharacterized protein n=1 Tax=Conexibacter stalactiti TaxID=1940611 RepID=A0ABU4HUV5_9ACTN|nr:hypothetical protein [Conexibacter stalactiti]MDW5597117.1 hypothetical protein [Conexibacter stalactiti]MEC5037759.1 hypothetical protein [Conexibacter stalactiti]
MRSLLLGATIAAVATAITASASVTTTAADAVQRTPVSLVVSLDHDARPGEPTALNLGLRIDLRRQPAPLTMVSLRYPATIGVTTSGLGIEPCRWPPSDFEAVVIELTSQLGCPRNSVMGVGTASGQIRMDGTAISREVGTISVHSGPLIGERLQLVTLVDGVNPIGARLVFAGEVRPASKPYGGELTLRIRPLPPSWRASIALSELDLAIGSPEIVYHDRAGGKTMRYRPDGIVLPARCPRGAFRFAAMLRFADGRRIETSAVAACPS